MQQTMTNENKNQETTKFTSKDVQKLATLSRLKIEENKENVLIQELSKIKELLDEVATFSNTKLQNVTNDSYVFDVLRFEENAPKQSPALRKDVAKPGMAIEETEKLAPSFAMRHFTVPQVIDGEEQ